MNEINAINENCRIDVKIHLRMEKLQALSVKELQGECLNRFAGTRLDQRSLALLAITRNQGV